MFGSQCVINRFCRVDLRFAFGGVFHRADGGDQRFCFGNLIGALGFHERVIVGDLRLLVVGQCVISRSRRVDLRFAFGGVFHLADRVDLVHRVVRLCGVVRFLDLGVFCFRRGQFVDLLRVDLSLLCVGQRVVSRSCRFDDGFAFERDVLHGGDGVDLFVRHRYGKDRFGVRQHVVVGDEGFLFVGREVVVSRSRRFNGFLAGVGPAHGVGDLVDQHDDAGRSGRKVVVGAFGHRAAAEDFYAPNTSGNFSAADGLRRAASFGRLQFADAVGDQNFVAFASADVFLFHLHVIKLVTGSRADRRSARAADRLDITAGDRDVCAGRIPRRYGRADAGADTRRAPIVFIGGTLGVDPAAGNFDVRTVRGVRTGSDARSPVFAAVRFDDTAADFDSGAGRIVPRSDSGARRSAVCGDRAAFDHDRSAIRIKTTADTRGVLCAVYVQRAVARDRQLAVVGNENTGAIFRRTSDGIFPFENEGCVVAGQAGVHDAVDRHVFERDSRAAGNGESMGSAERAGQNFAVLRHVVGREGGKVDKGGVRVRAFGYRTFNATDGNRAARAAVTDTDAVCGVFALRCRNLRYRVRNRYIVASAGSAAADARSVVSAGRGDGAAADRDGAAGTLKAAADACSVVSADRGDVTAADGDVAAGILIAGADAHRAGCGDGTAVDRDVAAGRTNGSADACRAGSSRRVDDAVVDDDIAAAAVPVRTDPCGVAVGACGKSSFALDGQRFAVGNIDTGIILIKALDGVLALKDNRRVAETGNARPGVTDVVFAVDDRVLQGHGRAVRDGNLVVSAERAGQNFAVLRRISLGQRGKIDRRSFRARRQGCLWQYGENRRNRYDKRQYRCEKAFRRSFLSCLFHA